MSLADYMTIDIIWLNYILQMPNFVLFTLRYSQCTPTELFDQILNNCFCSQVFLKNVPEKMRVLKNACSEKFS